MQTTPTFRYGSLAAAARITPWCGGKNSATPPHAVALPNRTNGIRHSFFYVRHFCRRRCRFRSACMDSQLRALSGTDSFLCARCKSILWGAPEKGGVSTRGETLAKELNLERSDFVFDRQPDAFRSGRAHQWLIGDVTEEKFSAHNR